MKKKPTKLVRHNRLNKRDLVGLLDFARGLARSSGALAMSYYGRANPTLRFDRDLITEADLAIQDYIHKEVQSTYPDHCFLGEEGSTRPNLADVDEPLWVVDPVDGSASFSAGMPIWGISIALFDGPRPVIGVIYLPSTDELYSAAAGEPATLNFREIQVRDAQIDNESLLLTFSRFHASFTTHFTGKVRALGSTAAHLAFVARGAAAGAILGNVHVWDIAAGAVILEAAGGTLRTMDGKKVELSDFLSGERIDPVLVAAPRGQNQEIANLLEPR